MIAAIINVFIKKTINDSTPSKYNCNVKPYIDHVNAANMCNITEYECISSVVCKFLTFHAWGMLDTIEKIAPIDAKNNGKSI